MAPQTNYDMLCRSRALTLLSKSRPLLFLILLGIICAWITCIPCLGKYLQLTQCSQDHSSAKAPLPVFVFHEVHYHASFGMCLYVLLKLSTLPCCCFVFYPCQCSVSKLGSVVEVSARFPLFPFCCNVLPGLMLWFL